jgi:hypothetical protein
MVKLAIAILLASSPALAQGSGEPTDCQPIGQTAKGELVYGIDCKALNTKTLNTKALKTNAKTGTTGADYKPDMPATNLPDTVIPKAGGKESPPETQPSGEMK